MSPERPMRDGDLERRRTAAIAAVAPVGLLLLVEPLVFKLIQADAMVGEGAVAGGLLAWASDAALALGAMLVFLPFAALTRNKIRAAGLVSYYLLAAIALVIDAASHGYFAATGSHLSLSSLEVWTSHMEETNTVIAGEALTWKLPLTIAQAVAVLALAVAPLLGPVRRRIEAFGGLRAKAAVVAMVALLLVFVGALAAPSLGGRLAAISRAVPVSMVRDLFARCAEGDGAAGGEGARQAGATTLRFEEEEGAPRPNIVLIIFESLNWKSSDVYVEGRGTTPFLASIAAESAVVDRHYTVIPHTSKAIVPILCGLYPYIGNERKESTPGILPRRCMAHVLRGQGYATAFFQPAMDFEDRGALVKNMGFETFVGLDDMSGRGFESISYFGKEDKIMLEPSMTWVESVEDAPFFLTYLTLATHHNYVTPQSFPSVDFPEDDPDHENYLNAVRYVDDFVKEVFAAFEARGLMDDTVFIIVGDHGEAFAEHARRQHDLIMWEEGLRCLAMIRGPEALVKPGRIDGVRSHLDLVPTVLDLLGLTPKDERLEGTSLFAPAPKGRKLLHSCWFNRQCLAMREGSLKTIYHYSNQRPEVFDNAVDEQDERDLAGTAPYDTAFLDARKDEMLEWRGRVNAEYRAWEDELTRGKILTEAPRIAHPMSARFGGGIELVGYDVFPARVTAGKELSLTYVFKCLEEQRPTTELFVHVDRGRGHLNADHVPVGGTHPVSKWKAGEYIIDDHVVRIPGDWKEPTAPVRVGFWDKRTGKRLEVFGDGLDVDDDRLLVAQIPVERRRSSVGAMTDEELREKIADSVSTSEPPFGKRLGVVFGDAVELVGVTLERTDVKLAGTVEMTYVFKVLREVPKGWKLNVRLEGEGSARVKGDHVPIGGLYPPRMWRPGEYITDRHFIHIDMYKSKVGDYGAWLWFTEGGRTVAATAAGGDVEIDAEGRVRLADVRIAPRTEKQ